MLRHAARLLFGEMRCTATCMVQLYPEALPIWQCNSTPTPTPTCCNRTSTKFERACGANGNRAYAQPSPYQQEGTPHLRTAGVGGHAHTPAGGDPQAVTGSVGTDLESECEVPSQWGDHTRTTTLFADPPPQRLAAARMGKMGGRAGWQNRTHEVAGHEHMTRPGHSPTQHKC